MAKDNRELQPDAPIRQSPGIETLYRGIRFRSRLEARWAAFFDVARWQWEYEPFDADGYIPDFALLGDHPVLVEIKPAASLSDLAKPLRYATSRVREHWSGDVLCLGVSPLLPSRWGAPCLGLLARWQEEWAHDDWQALGRNGVDPILCDHFFDDDLPGYFGPMEALWARCSACRRLTFTPSAIGCARALTPSICDHGRPALTEVKPTDVAPEWAAATNAVRWVAR